MEQLSILSNIVNYIQNNRHPKNFHNLNIKAVHKKRYKRKLSIEKEEERHMLELEFGDTPEKLREEYLDVYEGIQSEILSTTRFNENSDLTTTYLGRVNTTKTSKTMAEESLLILEQGYMKGKIIRCNRMSNIIRHRS